MNLTRGNLAVKPVHSGKHNTVKRRAGRMMPVISPATNFAAGKSPRLKVRRVSARETELRQNLARDKAREINRLFARRRIVTMIWYMSLITIVSAIFGLVVYRQAMILEANFSNLKIERTIAKMNQESSQISESLAQRTNLDLIRRRAIDDLGLQDPARSQVIGVHVPDTDRVVYAAAGDGKADQELYLNNVFNNIEGFFKTMNQQRQVD